MLNPKPNRTYTPSQKPNQELSGRVRHVKRNQQKQPLHLPIPISQHTKNHQNHTQIRRLPNRSSFPFPEQHTIPVVDGVYLRRHIDGGDRPVEKWLRRRGSRAAVRVVKRAGVSEPPIVGGVPDVAAPIVREFVIAAKIEGNGSLHTFRAFSVWSLMCLIDSTAVLKEHLRLRE